MYCSPVLDSLCLSLIAPTMFQHAFARGPDLASNVEIACGTAVGSVRLGSRLYLGLDHGW